MKTRSAARTALAANVVVEVAVSCPVCRDHGHNARVADSTLLAYKPVYLRGCETHRDAWEIADRRDRAREAAAARKDQKGRTE